MSQIQGGAVSDITEVVAEQDIELYNRISDFDLIDFLCCPACGTSPLVGPLNVEGKVYESDGVACPGCGAVYSIWVTDGQAGVVEPPEGRLCSTLLIDLCRRAGLP